MPITIPAAGTYYSLHEIKALKHCGNATVHRAVAAGHLHPVQFSGEGQDRLPALVPEAEVLAWFPRTGPGQPKKSEKTRLPQ